MTRTTLANHEKSFRKVLCRSCTLKCAVSVQCTLKRKGGGVLKSYIHNLTKIMLSHIDTHKPKVENYLKNSPSDATNQHALITKP